MTHEQGHRALDQSRTTGTVHSRSIGSTTPPLGVAGTSPQVTDGQPASTSFRLTPIAKTSAAAARTSNPAVVIARTWPATPRGGTSPTVFTGHTTAQYVA